MWLLLVVLLVPVGVKAGALRQTRGEDADRTEVKGKSTTIMHHFDLKVVWICTLQRSEFALIKTAKTGRKFESWLVFSSISDANVHHGVHASARWKSSASFGNGCSERTRAFVFGKWGQSSPPWALCVPGEQWVGLPVGAVLMGSFVEVVGWRTQQRGAARGETRAARNRKRCQQQKP